MFRPDWLTRDEFVGQLADADVGVSLHLARSSRATRAGRASSTTSRPACRCLASRGDTMSDLVAAHGLGRVVAPDDDDACARGAGLR